MKNLVCSKLSLDDLVFEHRNKAYGAFVMRKNYSKTMTRSLLLAILFFVAAFLSPGFIQSFYLNDQTSFISNEDKIHEIVSSPVFAKVIVQSSDEDPNPPKVKKAATSGLPTQVVDDIDRPLNNPTSEHVDNYNPKNDHLMGVGIGMNDTLYGNSDSGNVGNNNPFGVSSSDEVFLVPDELPVFGEGRESLNRYLEKTISFPQLAKDNRIEGKVIIEFIIDKNGEVKLVNVLRGIGGGCDEEVIRAIAHMPKWKAGKHHGKPVNVKLILPVTFKVK